MLSNNDFLKATGELELILVDEFDVVKEHRKIPNLVVTVGKNWIAARMKEDGRPGQMSHMAVGTNNANLVVGNTALATEVGRVALTTAGGTVSTNEVTYTATFPAGVGSGALVEAGILNASSSGTLLCRTTYSVITKGAADSLTINWKVTIN